jgi:8-oxo-dGTP pyrophosphatase MutT (NUDIX family)
VPGGGVEEGEAPEDAVLRELFEEAGMTALPVVRRLGIQRYYKPYTQRFIERYDYLFCAPSDAPNRWQHSVPADRREPRAT